jgi:nucleotide-binding universal stress UspA family protein
MDTILCATRGGEASLQTQRRAIEIAKERGARIIFIFVVDVRFLEHYTAPYIPAMADEMKRLGEFLLLMAQERAEQAGVEAGYTVRRGALEPVLIEAAKEYGASLVILGRPGDKGVTSLEYLEQKLCPAIEAETGIKTVLA